MHLRDGFYLTSDLLAMIKLFTGNVAISLLKELPLKDFYISDKKGGLGKFGDTSIKTSLGSLANSFLKYDSLCHISYSEGNSKIFTMNH